MGYGFGNGFRVEVSGNFYRNTVDKIKYNNLPWAAATGGLNTYGPMVNALYDINFGLADLPLFGCRRGLSVAALQ